MKNFIAFIFYFFLFQVTYSQNEGKLLNEIPDGLSNTFELNVDSLLIGCNANLRTKVLPNFKLKIEEKNKQFNDKPSGVDLYGIKFKNIKDKKKLIKALDEYCVYGWANYYFESSEFLIFSYSMRSYYFIQDRRKNETWQEIENSIKKALNEQNVFQQNNSKQSTDE